MKLNKKIGVRIVFTVLILLSMFIFFTNTKYSGLVTFEKTYSESLNETISENGNYTLQLNFKGNLSSLRLTGQVVGEGKARVYLGEKLVVEKDTSESKSLAGLTGRVSEEVKYELNETFENESVVNETVELIVNESVEINGTAVNETNFLN